MTDLPTKNCSNVGRALSAIKATEKKARPIPDQAELGKNKRVPKYNLGTRGM
jgi:hypothetical protein